MIYLDNNATTRLDPRVAETMSDIFKERYANPSSQHQEGRRARDFLEANRLAIGMTLEGRVDGLFADEVIFTSGGTEANNLALFGMLEGKFGDLVVSSIEHPSLLGAAHAIAEEKKHRVRYLPVDRQGRVCLATWNRWLQEHVEAKANRTATGQIAMVSVMVANNETGVIQPIESIVESARQSEILVHTDAVQAIGKIPVHFADSSVDAMTISAHKLHGPVGIGALVVRKGISISPRLHGGFQQQGIRPGTESIHLIAGLSQALQLAIENLEERSEQMTALRLRLEDAVLVDPSNPTIIGLESRRLPHTISLAFPGIERQVLQMALDREGIACSTGSACASGSGQTSHVLQAMQLPKEIVDGGIRLSLSYETTVEEIDEAARRILGVVHRLQYKDL